MGKPLGEIKRFPRSGGADAFFDQLCRAHEAQLLAYLTQMLGRVDLAREAIQDTYEQLHRMYRPEQVLFPRAILFKVATRYALMQLRRRRVESAMIGGPAGMEQVPDLGGEPERQVMAEQIEQRVAHRIRAGARAGRVAQADRSAAGNFRTTCGQADDARPEAVSPEVVYARH